MHVNNRMQVPPAAILLPACGHDSLDTKKCTSHPSFAESLLFKKLSSQKSPTVWPPFPDESYHTKLANLDTCQTDFLLEEGGLSNRRQDAVQGSSPFAS